MSNKTILFADDSATMRIAMERTFAAEPFDVVTVPSGEAAVKKAREIQPSIIITDSSMATGMSGYDVCQTIRGDSLLAGTPLLLLSGVSDPFDESLSKKVGIDAHMKKPFDTTQIIEKVASLTSVSQVPDAVAASPAIAVGAPPIKEKPAAPATPGGAAPRTGAEPIPLTARPPSRDRAETAIPGPVAQKPAAAKSKQTMKFGQALSATGDSTVTAPFAAGGKAAKPADEAEPLDELDLEPVEVAPEPPAPRASGAFQVGTLAELAQMDGKGKPIKPEVGSDAIELTKKAGEEKVGKVEKEKPAVTVRAPVAAGVKVNKRAETAAKSVAEQVEGVTPEQVEAIRQLTKEVIEKVVWEVVPDLAEVIIKEELAKLLKE